MACGGGDDGDDEGNGEEKTSKTSKPTTEKTVKPTKELPSGSGGFTWDDIPIYPGADKMDKATLSFSGGEDRNFEKIEWRYYTTDDDPEDVHSFYLDKMPDHEWDKVMDMTAGQVMYSMWQKNDGDTGAWIGVGEGDDNDETVIWMWRGQGLNEEGEIEESEETEEPDDAETPESSPTMTPTDPVPFGDLIPFLPEVPSDWDSDEPTGMTMTMDEWAWSQAMRDYSNEDEGEYVSVGIYDSAYYYGFAWMQTYEMHFEWESSDGYGKSITYHGYDAFETYSAPDSYMRMILVADRFMVMVNTQTEESLDLFSDLVDYEGLEDLE